MDILPLLIENPWLLLLVVVPAGVFIIHHKLKRKWKNTVVGPSLSKFAHSQHSRGVAIVRPPNMNGKRGELRSGSSAGGTKTFFRVKTWPFWATLVVIALSVGVVLAFLAWAGAI